MLMKNDEKFTEIKLLCIFCFLILISLNREIFSAIMSAVFSFVAAYLIAGAINKTADRLSAKILPGKRICRLMISIGALIVLIAVIRLLTVVISRQIGSFVCEIGDTAQQLADRISDLLGRDDFNALKDEMISLATDVAQKLTSFSLCALLRLPGVILSLGVFFCSLFYCTADFNSVNRFLSELLPENVKNFVRKKKKYSVKQIKSCIVGYFVLFWLTAAELFILFLIVKCENALLLGIVVALFDLMPLFGVGTVLVPWSIFAYFANERIKSVVLLSGFLLISFVRSLAEPEIISSRLGVHPLVTIFFAYLFVRFFGAIGVFLAPIGILTVKILLFDQSTDIQL